MIHDSETHLDDLPENAPGGAAETPETPEAADAAQAALKKTLLKAVAERKRRAENSVLRSMAEQNGVPEDELAALLHEAQSESGLPDEANERLAAITASATRRLLLAEVKSIGSELGLLDADVALRLIDPDALSVEEDGSVTGVREALDALKQDKKYLFSPSGRRAWAQRVGGGAPQISGVEEAFYRKNPALRR
ncbi:MAG: hypothetical protein PHY64_04700 [Eubacteriales bacterium]|nr:hypothetical protein [Eubacteriales bacterium]